MFKIIKWSFYIILILIIFAVLPKGVLDKIKQYFNWEIFLNTLKKGFQNLLNFIKETTGLDFSKIFEKLKNTFGIDLIALWSGIKNFFYNLFLKLANIFK